MAPSAKRFKRFKRLKRSHPLFKPIKDVVKPPTMPPVERPGRRTNQLNYISTIVMQSMWRHPKAWPFKQPFDARKLVMPEYHTIVKQPMDLSTINERLNNKYYWSAKEALYDFKLIFENCYKCSPHPDVDNMARSLESFFYKKIADMPEEEEEEEEEEITLEIVEDVRGREMEGHGGTSPSRNTDSPCFLRVMIIDSTANNSSVLAKLSTNEIDLWSNLGAADNSAVNIAENAQSEEKAAGVTIQDLGMQNDISKSFDGAIPEVESFSPVEAQSDVYEEILFFDDY